MSKHVEAVYKNGAFHPMEPIELPELQRVTVEIPDSDDIEPVWRGVFVTTRHRDLLFTKEIDISEKNLRKRPFTVHIDPDRVDENDE